MLTIESNVSGTEAVLRNANKKGKKILIASTSEVYDKSNQIPFWEDSDLVLGSTTNSRLGSACSKAIDEFPGLAYLLWRKESSSTHMQTLIIRRPC
jgi:UDP-glucose 4-epimerase